MDTSPLIKALRIIDHELGGDFDWAPPAVYKAAQAYGGKSLLAGDRQLVQRLLDDIPHSFTDEVVFEFFWYLAFYSDDGGRKLKSLVETWRDEGGNSRITYIASRANDWIRSAP